jgi:hypothetical protein
MIPAKADPERQEQFKQEQLEPALDQAKTEPAPFWWT